jgi:hypothetical protein
MGKDSGGPSRQSSRRNSRTQHDDLLEEMALLGRRKEVGLKHNIRKNAWNLYIANSCVTLNPFLCV